MVCGQEDDGTRPVRFVARAFGAGSEEAFLVFSPGEAVVLSGAVNPVYVGVDVAGADNTWLAALCRGADGGLSVAHGPRLASLAEIVGYCEENEVVAAAIDAQLTASLSEENGFRTSDMELRTMLRERQGSHNWVASASGLLAVPVRGRLLAEHLSPTVGTVLETHPRASLLFGLGEEALADLGGYREANETGRARVRALWGRWSERFGIISESVITDGALDSMVCATVAYLFHHEPIALHRLRHDAPGKTGRGPFYVVAPARRPSPAPKA